MSPLNRLKRGWQAFRRAVAIEFNAASTNRRMGNWMPSNIGSNSAIFAHGALLRARARDAARKNAWAARALDVSTSDGVGTGIMPVFVHDDPKIAKLAGELFQEWTDESDAYGITDFYGQQAQAWRAMMQDGECFVRMRRRRPSDGMTVPLQLQLLEADYVPLDKNEELADGNSIRMGIEFNAIGKRVAYWMYREHPGELFSFGQLAGELVRVPASEVLHLFRPMRPGQIRGLPWFTPVLTKLWDLEKCEDASLLRMQIANMLTAFIRRTATPSDGIGPMNETNNGDGTAIATLGPGTTVYLEDNEEPIFSKPPDIGNNYDTFLTSSLRAIAVGVGLTYEKLTGDLTKTNFSSMRGGELGYRRFIETLQHQVLVYQFCRPVQKYFLEQAMLAGAMPAAQIRTFAKTEWQPPLWPWIDPVKDITAANMEVRSGFNSRTRVCASRGLRSEQIDAEQSNDNERADQEGVQYDSDGRQAKAAGSQPGQPKTNRRAAAARTVSTEQKSGKATIEAA